MDRIPPAATIHLKTKDDISLERLKSLLAQHHVVLLHMGWEDEKAVFMQEIIEKIGVVNLHDASESSSVWDINPQGPTNTASAVARSHTMEEVCKFI